MEDAFDKAMYRYVMVLLLSVGSLALLPTPTFAQSDSVVVDIDGLVFEEPDDRSRVVLRVRAGEELSVVSRSGKWVRVQLPRGTGWILGRITRDAGGSSSLAGRGDSGATQIKVVDEYADVKAGPGDAYLGIKRVFKGDTFEVARYNEDASWVQVKIGGDLGWIRADQTLRADAVFDKSGGGSKGGGGGQASAGDGPLGASSEFDERDLSAPDPELSQIIENDGKFDDKKPGSGATGLTLRLGGVFQSSSQTFDSNATNRLDFYETGSSLFGADLNATWFFIDWVGVALDYTFGLGSPIVIPFEETGVQAELKNSTQRVHARVIGRYPFGSGRDAPWVGASVGGVYHNFDIQQTTIPVFLPNTYTGARVGLDGAVPVGPVNIWASGWYVLASSVSQGDLNSGTEASVSSFGAEVGVEATLFGDFGVFTRLLYDRSKTSFSGQATRDESISQAVNTDQFITVGAGVIWRPL